MGKEERINQINNELKSYINESSFISNSCRNKMLKIFEDIFQVSLDIGSYKNVDLKVLDDFTFLYREDIYKPTEEIHSLEEFEEKYSLFKEKADALIRRRNVDFQGRRNLNSFTNLIIVICLFLLMIALIVIGVSAFLSGRYMDCIWFAVVILPWIVPKIKQSLQERIQLAKQYIKSLLKKVK